MKENGKLIVVCGIDGSGKTTLQKKIHEYLLKKDISTKITKQPTDFYRNNEHVRKFLDTGKCNVSEEAIALLSAADRKCHIDEFINPNINNGHWVISDRYVYSSYAYFKARGVDLSFVKEINKYTREADFVIFLKLDANIAIDRVIKRDNNSRKFEEKNADYLNKVQEYMNNEVPTNSLVLDATLNEEDIFNKTIQYLGE